MSAVDADEQHNDVAPRSPPQPKGDIEANQLLSQAYASLTIKQLRDLLRQHNGTISGNKRELVDRLGGILLNEQRSAEIVQQNSTTAQSTKKILPIPNNNGGKRKLLDSYNHMTLNELKDLLRQRGANVSGNKRELVHRLMNLRYKSSIDQTQSLPRNENNLHSESMTGTETERSWSILEPSMTFMRESNATTEASENPTKSKDEDLELPSLSGLIFVNKPSGFSTLPTKQQLDDPTCPTNYPCLSDSVKKWLYNHPEGQQRMKQALKEEERWWDFILQSLPQDKKRRKKWKKKKEKQEVKMSTFEPRPVHRLDIDTSGIVCIALTPYALRAANMLFERKSRGSFEDDRIVENRDETPESNGELQGVQKQYVALVEGTLLGNEQGDTTKGMVKHSIGKVWIDDHHEWACDISGNGTVAFIRPDPDDVPTFVPDTLREAITSYQTVNWSSRKPDMDVMVNDVTRVELTPHTGRGHQLRLHMASIGHPIVGDDMHGPTLQPAVSTQINGGRLCLHASQLSMDAWCLSTDGTTNYEFQRCRVDVESCPPV